MSALLKSVRSLKADYVALQQKNEELTADLVEAQEHAEAAIQPRRGKKGKGPTMIQLQNRNTELKVRVRDLEKVSDCLIKLAS